MSNLVNSLMVALDVGVISLPAYKYIDSESWSTAAKDTGKLMVVNFIVDLLYSSIASYLPQFLSANLPGWVVDGIVIGLAFALYEYLMGDRSNLTRKSVMAAVISVVGKWAQILERAGFDFLRQKLQQ